MSNPGGSRKGGWERRKGTRKRSWVLQRGASGNARKGEFILFHHFVEGPW